MWEKLVWIITRNLNLLQPELGLRDGETFDW